MGRKRPPPRFRETFRDAVEDIDEFEDCIDLDELEKIFSDMFLEIEMAEKLLCHEVGDETGDELEREFGALLEKSGKPEMRGGGGDEEKDKEAEEKNPKRRRQMSLSKMFGGKEEPVKVKAEVDEEDEVDRMSRIEK